MKVTKKLKYKFEDGDIFISRERTNWLILRVDGKWITTHMSLPNESPTTDEDVKGWLKEDSIVWLHNRNDFLVVSDLLNLFHLTETE